MTAARLFLTAVLLAVSIGAASAAELRRFATPDAAAGALVAAVRAQDRATLLAILGGDAASILNSGDPVADASIRERFLSFYDQGHKFDHIADRATLQIGPSDWPFPIPLRRDAKGWRFDTPAGKQEILLRRIGGNELSTIETMEAYVDAQEEYGELQRAAGAMVVYAQRIFSTPGKRDGLYWPTGANEPPSPFGPLIAQAHAEGYRERADGAAGQTPYHGYLYRVLTQQGLNAAGGAVDYVVDGKMIGGFALIAWPARWGDSGVMTFIVNHHGVVYQKNLGPTTAQIAPQIKQFNPDPTWQPVELP